jgi:NADPH-dependent ferric siderophore reductase
MPAPLVTRSPVHTGVVLANTALTPRMRRVTIRAESLRDLTIRPAQDLELHLRDETGRRVKRRYTIRQARPGDAEFDVDVVLHGQGPGAEWGASARPGDPVACQGPRGKLELRAAPWHLLAGDESALPAIAAICEALPAAESAFAVVEVADAAEQLPLPPGTTVRWVHRDGQPPGTPELLRTGIAALDLPPGAGRGYLMGETRSMVALRALLEQRGLEHDAIFVKGYWNIARPDRLAGRRPEQTPIGAPDHGDRVEEAG